MIDKDIRHFKLINGEEILSFVKENDDDFLLEMPIKVHSVVNNQTQGFFFTKWQALSGVDICSINKNTVISHVVVGDLLKEKYIQLCVEYRQEASEDLLDWMDSPEMLSENYDEHDQFIDDMLDYEMGSDSEVYH